MIKPSSLLSVIVFFIFSFSYAQETRMVGAGVYSSGSIFSVNEDGSNAENLFEMSSNQVPDNCELVEYDGKFWGMATLGGTNDHGVIFTLEFDGTGYQKVHDFDGTNGSSPRAGLIVSGNKLWGTTYKGGTNDDGTIFSFDPDGNVLQKVHEFESNVNGRLPYGRLTEVNGNFWGTTSLGGADGGGVAFRIKTDGTNFIKIHDFETGTGIFLVGDLLEHDGKLFGMAGTGGSFFGGAIYSIGISNDEYSVVHHFDRDAHGGSPNGTLLLSSGKLWGTTTRSASASEGTGTIFSINPDGTGYSEIHDLTLSEGSDPRTGLLENNGKIWGTAASGGENDAGSIFSVNTDGTDFSVFYSFAKTMDARTPRGSLVEKNGKIFGISRSGGTSGNGAIYSFNTDGSAYEVAHSFNDAPPTGFFPQTTLIQVGERLFGTNRSGGNEDYGVLFYYDLSNGSYNKIFDFEFENGSSPSGNFLRKDGKLYGVTNLGGMNDAGVLYSISDDGTGFQKLFDFSDTDGSQQGGLTEVDGKIWGNTFGGGGVVYSIGFDGSGYEIVRNFSNVDGLGSAPDAGLLEHDGLYWGVTQGGGANSSGVIYSIKSDGTEYTVRHDFDNSIAALPLGSMIEANGKFWGTTRFGANVSSNGVIFTLDADGTNFTVVHNLATDEATSGYLTEYNNKIWGTTNLGGSEYLGFVFSIDTDGTNFTIVKEFTSEFGGTPRFISLIPVEFKDQQEITLSIAEKTYGDASFSPGATSVSSNSILYSSSNEDVLSFLDGTATIQSAGEVTVTAMQIADTQYFSGKTEQMITIDKAALKATATDLEINEGDAIPELTIAYSGFVNSETIDVIDTAPTTSVEATTSSEAGEYDIILTGGSDENYDIELVNGVLTINNALSVDSPSDGITFYPNPTTEKLIFDSNYELNISLFDLQGRKVLESKSVREITLSTIEAGTYLLRVSDQTGKILFTKRVLKK